jgi:hypothetical protein
MLINRARIIEFSKRRGLLLASGFGPWAREGAVLSYGPDTDASTMRAAAYVDKILRGAKLDELPIEQPTKFQLVINRKAAKSLSLDIPAVAARYRRSGHRISTYPLLHCRSPLLAHSGHSLLPRGCPLSGVKQTSK